MTTETTQEIRAQLPHGWQWVRLSDVCEERTGTRDPALEPNALFRYVDISSVDNTTKRIIEAKVLLGKDAPSRARQIIRANDVIVSTTRPNLNAVALIPSDLDGEVCSTGFSVLRPTKELTSQYLFAFVQSASFIKSLSDLVKGALYPAVTDSQVREQFIPLPPLLEQHRIASLLAQQMAAIEQAGIATEARLEAARAFPKALLRQVFESEEIQKWERKKLGKLLQLRKDVVYPKDKPKGPAIFVGLEHIETLTGERIGSISLEMSKLTGRKPRFYKNDIVYGYLRPYLNKVWIAEFDGLCSVDQYVYSVNPDLADTEYVAWFMRSPIYLNRAPIDTTPGQLPRIRTEEVASVEIELPPPHIQREIMTVLKYQLESAKTAYTAIESQVNAITVFPTALLRRALSGDL